MTTTVIGQLPCPECNTTTDLKSDGRKHTLKCPECGVLAYYQSQNAKQYIEQRLKENSKGDLQKTNAITLQLPEHSEAQQRYLLTVEPLGIESVNGEMTTMDNSALAANDENIDNTLSNNEDNKASPQKRSFFESFTEFL